MQLRVLAAKLRLACVQLYQAGTIGAAQTPAQFGHGRSECVKLSYRARQVDLCYLHKI